jgi:hypothetical protein
MGTPTFLLRERLTFFNNYKNPPESRFMVTSFRSAHIVVLGNAGSVFLVNYIKKNLQLIFVKCQENLY